MVTSATFASIRLVPQIVTSLSTPARSRRFARNIGNASKRVRISFSSRLSELAALPSLIQPHDHGNEHFYTTDAGYCFTVRRPGKRVDRSFFEVGQWMRSPAFKGL